MYLENRRQEGSNDFFAEQTEEPLGSQIVGEFGCGSPQTTRRCCSTNLYNEILVAKKFYKSKIL